MLIRYGKAKKFPSLFKSYLLIISANLSLYLIFGGYDILSFFAIASLRTGPVP